MYPERSAFSRLRCQLTINRGDGVDANRVEHFHAHRSGRPACPDGPPLVLYIRYQLPDSPLPRESAVGDIRAGPIRQIRVFSLRLSPPSLGHDGHVDGEANGVSVAVCRLLEADQHPMRLRGQCERLSRPLETHPPEPRINLIASSALKTSSAVAMTTHLPRFGPHIARLHESSGMSLEGRACPGTSKLSAVGGGYPPGHLVGQYPRASNAAG
jgi:hypothetical protein